MTRQPIRSPLYSVPMKGWTQGIRVPAGSDLIFVSGLTARGVDGQVIEADIETQARKIFDNLQTILSAAEATLDDVVQMRLYMKDFRDHPIVHRVRLEYFGEPLPASTGVAVTHFYDERQLLEIEAVAAVKVDRQGSPKSS